MKKWIALILALVTVLTLTACGDNGADTNTSSHLLQPEGGWGKAEGYNGKILGIWYNLEENAGMETIYGFSGDGILVSAKDMDATDGYAWYYVVDEESKTVSIYEQNNKEGEHTFEEELGELLGTAQIEENGDTIYLIGENSKGEPVGMAREADLEAARAAYPEYTK